MKVYNYYFTDGSIVVSGKMSSLKLKRFIKMYGKLVCKIECGYRV